MQRQPRQRQAGDLPTRDYPLSQRLNQQAPIAGREIAYKRQRLAVIGQCGRRIANYIWIGIGNRPNGARFERQREQPVFFSDRAQTAEDDPFAILAPTQYRVLSEIQIGANPEEPVQRSLRPSSRGGTTTISANWPFLPDKRTLPAVGRPRREGIGRRIAG